MKKKVLFIGSSYLVTQNIQKALSKSYDVMMVQLGITVFDKIKNSFKPDAVLLYLEPNVRQFSKIFFDYICSEELSEACVVVIASDQEWEDFSSGYEDLERTVKIYYRPISTDRICHIIDKESKRFSVLIADDDVNFLVSIKEFLKDYYKVYAVNNGRNAIDFVSKIYPDAIVVDINMGGALSGIDVVAEIRRNENLKSLPVYFLTGKQDKNTVLKCMNYHPVGYLIKPISQPDLLKELSKSLAHFDENDNLKPNLEMKPFSFDSLNMGLMENTLEEEE
ncbi:Response regulator receiver domain-containing protein [Acetitomaculum ruminis DSM 5522]|uniref:Stage 0 sporulation protein A homolog n=1 Tax=Acetitomaculum ruminis DSM 5522 TaxID=1120918 RepID=A0A1I0YMQ8_9FIRM|nr:response regulator [Acetitomaculum ruminis]SFB13413.1 Response regulator receiver domain-containing protein [Acetitomaculum ruminis DSM 5522]